MFRDKKRVQKGRQERCGIVKYSSIGLFAGLILGVLAACILYFSDRTVKDEEKPKEITGAELLARAGTK